MGNGNFKACLWASMYGRQMKAWLKLFLAVQFYVIPMHSYVAGNTIKLCTKMSETFRLGLSCKGEATAPDINAHVKKTGKKPKSLEDATSSETLTMFTEFMDPENELLFELLAKAFNQGATLYGYSGCGGAHSIGRWLKSKW